MKLIFSVFFLFISTHSFSQTREIINLAFSEQSNFDLLTVGEDKKPTRYFVLKTTDKWNSSRFHINENLRSDSVRRRLERDEHSAYNNSYIFKDTLLNRTIGDTEKENLYKSSQYLSPKQLPMGFKGFTMIDAFTSAKPGFFFSITEPLFSSDMQYAFIDITVYKKSEETKKLDDSYFGRVLLVYQKHSGNDWQRLRKINHLML
jgi:hypothetical protein